jgi:hypothetical protein
LADAKPSKSGSWLAQRRFQLALWIAIFEGILIEVVGSVSWVVALIIAIPFILFYLLAGRTSESDLGRQLSWIAGASQTFVVMIVILFKIIPWLLILMVALLAVVAFVFLYSDRPSRATKP